MGRIMKNSRFKGLSALFIAGLLLTACDGGMDMGGFNLRDPQPGGVAPRPEADARGIITYPNYQVAVAKRGDTVSSMAARIGLGAKELARHNGLSPEQELREGELLALPRKVAASSGVDIETLAGNAINSAGQDTGQNRVTNNNGIEPIRHQVESGETAYSIARLYGVSVTALASWNGLGSDLNVRVGQQLLIPVVENHGQSANNSKPGAGTLTPVPPSASKPLPAGVKTETLPESPNLGALTTAGDRKFLIPVDGKIIRNFSGKQGGNEGIDIAASAGSAVKAAENGEVALISKSVGSNTIVLLRHADNIYTVYSNVGDVKLTKGQKIKRGQRLGAIASGNPAYLHFEVRQGTQSVDPKKFF